MKMVLVSNSCIFFIHLLIHLFFIYITFIYMYITRLPQKRWIHTYNMYMSVHVFLIRRKLLITTSNLLMTQTECYFHHVKVTNESPFRYCSNSLKLISLYSTCTHWSLHIQMIGRSSNWSAFFFFLLVSDDDVSVFFTRFNNTLMAAFKENTHSIIYQIVKKKKRQILLCMYTVNVHLHVHVLKW